MAKPKKTDETTTDAATTEPETSGEITVTIDEAAPAEPTDTPPHTATSAGESVVDAGNGGRCW